jgi:uncharacterized protein YkwD
MVNKFIVSFLFVYFSGGYIFPGIGYRKDNSVDYSNFRNDPAYNSDIDFGKTQIGRINEVIFHLTNEIRVKHNLKPLTYSIELEKSATMHASDMVKGNFFNHINVSDPKKRTPNDRAGLCNIANPFLAENLIEGYGLRYTSYDAVYLRGNGKFSTTPDGELIKPHTYLSFGEEQLKRWMNSKEHRKNILSGDALQIGCGSAIFLNPEFNNMPSFYVVQNFQWYKPVEKIKP